MHMRAHLAKMPLMPLQVLTGENWPDLMKDLSATVAIAPL
jgi:hypothetical protein